MVTESTEERLVKLERATRHYRLVLAGMGMAILAAGVIWTVMATTGTALAQKPGGVPNVIRAHQFSIVDESGRDRGGLVVMKDGSVLLDLFDKHDSERFQVRVTDEGTVLMVRDENGQTRVVMGPGKTEQAGELTTYTESSVRLFDGSGSMIWSAP